MRLYRPLLLCAGLVVAGFGTSAFAADDPLSFPGEKIEKPPLGLIPPPRTTIPLQPKSFLQVPRAKLPPPTPKSRMPIISPDPSRDYRLAIVTPNPAVDYKLIIIPAGPTLEEPEKKPSR